jgi:hypothetical protein
MEEWSMEKSVLHFFLLVTSKSVPLQPNQY